MADSIGSYSMASRTIYFKDYEGRTLSVEFSESQSETLTASLRYLDPVSGFARQADFQRYADFEEVIAQWRRDADVRREEVTRWRGVICQELFEQVDA